MYKPPIMSSQAFSSNEAIHPTAATTSVVLGSVLDCKNSRLESLVPNAARQNPER